MTPQKMIPQKKKIHQPGSTYSSAHGRFVDVMTGHQQEFVKLRRCDYGNCKQGPSRAFPPLEAHISPPSKNHLTMALCTFLMKFLGLPIRTS